MFAKTYIKKGLQPKNLSRTLEDSATVVEPIVPWTAAGVYMATTLGVPTLTYLPWAILCYTGVDVYKRQDRYLPLAGYETLRNVRQNNLL